MNDTKAGMDILVEVDNRSCIFFGTSLLVFKLSQPSPVVGVLLLELSIRHHVHMIVNSRGYVTR